MPGPGADSAPFAADGGPVGVLVLHGFTGSPQTVRPWAEHLAAAGLTVRAPLLAGHGAGWRELSATGWTDWFASAEQAFAETRGPVRAGVRGWDLDGRMPGLPARARRIATR